ncbi:hypothetical protein ATE48_08110 [Candidatus Viadribacter manganicus]|uniref:Uncharacterized protein n=1 Tax=Candidatus Viadribacter manganicus TaxID=1759059 RepID=A0A1B1AH41_9PROT|nr:hypothetical protein ATE48_08110 [Candidatus Viadribacter manganicus]
MRQIYGEMLAGLPDLNCQVVDRLVDGSYVMDHELCAVSPSPRLQFGAKRPESVRKRGVHCIRA